VGRWPRYFGQLKQVRPHRSRAAQVALQAIPRQPDGIWGDEQPHVSCVGLSHQSSHPVRSNVGIGVGKMRPEVCHRRSGPPEEVRPVQPIEEQRAGRGKGRFHFPLHSTVQHRHAAPEVPRDRVKGRQPAKRLTHYARPALGFFSNLFFVFIVRPFRRSPTPGRHVLTVRWAHVIKLALSL
jgi:hypothetical protein